MRERGRYKDVHEVLANSSEKNIIIFFTMLLRTWQTMLAKVIGFLRPARGLTSSAGTGLSRLRVMFRSASCNAGGIHPDSAPYDLRNSRTVETLTRLKGGCPCVEAIIK